MSREGDDRDGRVAVRWWQAMQPRRDGSGGDRGALARLRRASSVNDAAMEMATLDLCRALGRNADTLGGVAVAASVLAYVREDRPGMAFARALGMGSMSWLRFRRLIQSDSEDERLAAFRRAVALSGGTANVADLAVSLLGWTDTRRRRWLCDYHDAPVPESTAPTEDHAT